MERRNRSSEDVAEKVKTEIDQTWEQMLSSFDREFVCALGRVRASVVRDDDELF